MSEYKWTGAANLAKYYAGIISLKQGAFAEAIDYLESFKGKDKMVTAMAYGAIGDAYSETAENEKAITQYKKAAYHFENELTTPHFLKKAGLLLEMEKQKEEARKIYEEIKAKYPNSNEGRDMDKYIARLDAAG
jgi:tetratricopeptide (TPR) repeat protein